MLKQLKYIYDFLPKRYLSFIKYIPDRALFGKSYIDWQTKISFDKNIISQKLYDTMMYSKKHTKYGQENIPDNLSMENVKDVLASLPIISSYDLATNLPYYTSDSFNKLNSYYTATGGTGRNPTTILLSNELFGIEWAHVHHMWSLSGYDRINHIKLTLRGKSLKRDSLVEYNPIYNELVVDTFKVRDSNFLKLKKELQKYNIKYIHGYTSLVKEYMIYFERYNLKLNLDGILLASEAASVEDKKMITSFFKCKVVSFYGQSERALIAVDEKNNGMYKVYTSYGYPRIVEGELVITSFVNRALPLINYKIGDGAEIIEDNQCIYIRNVTSRWGKDFIYLDKNKKISTTAINIHSMVQDELLYYQIHQDEYAKITIKIVQKSTSDMESEKLLEVFYSEMKNNLKDFQIDLKLVDQSKIVKSKRGKMMFLVQKIDLD